METLEPFRVTAAEYAEFIAVQAEVIIARCGGPSLSAAGRKYILTLFDKLHAVSPFSLGVCEVASAVRETT